MTLEATPKGVLDGMYELLRLPERWTKHDSARTASGLGTSALDPKAISWCMLGAMTRQLADLCGGDVTYEWQTLSQVVRQTLYDTMDSDQTLATYNDSHTHEEVLALINRASDSLAAA